MEKLYRIEEYFTNGWETIDSEATKLTREQCDLMLNNYLSLGINPKNLRAVPDND